MSKMENKYENRLKLIKKEWYFFCKFMEITLGNIKYTNDDLNELIEYYSKKEKYMLCEKLNKLKNNLEYDNRLRKY